MSDLCDILINAYWHLLEMQREDGIRRRRWWVRPIISKRKEFGHCQNLMKEMTNRDPDWFFKYCRMNIDQFEWILDKITPGIEKKYVVREPISPRLRLFVTLRHLATGDNHFTLATEFRIGVSTVGEIIREVCDFLWTKFADQVFPEFNAENWSDISRDFSKFWNFPHVVGCIDGKHIKILAPKNSGSLYYSYKDYYSIVILAIADARYRFTYVNIGAFGSSSDGGILTNSTLGRMLTSGEINFPADAPISPGEPDIPFFLLGDEAFGLRNWCMVPYAGRHLEEDKEHFNKRLSRSRRVVENAFGILAARWRIFHRTICAKPESVESLIKATVILHNFLCTSSEHMYAPPNFIDRERNGNTVEGSWRVEAVGSRMEEIPPGLRLGSRNPTRSASEIRDYLKDYLNNRRIY